MKLIYVYVKEFKLFSEKEFNLDSGYSVHYDIKTNELEITQRRGLKADFWSVSTTPIESPVVESVSAIIGENGSGKSTFAQILLELFRESGVHDFECIAISEKDSALFVYRTSGLTVSVKHDPSICVTPDTWSFPIDIPATKCCYYSPVYTTERDRGRELWDDGDTCYDLSTTGILQSYTRDINIRDRDVFTAFDIDEKRRVLEFLAVAAKKRCQAASQAFPNIIPRAVWLETDSLAIKQVQDKVEDKLKMLHAPDEEVHKAVSDAESVVRQCLERILILAKKRQNPDFFIRAFMTYGILHLYDLNLPQLLSVGLKLPDLQLLDFLETISDSTDQTATIRGQIFDFLDNNTLCRFQKGEVVDDSAEKTILKTFQYLMNIVDDPLSKEYSGMLHLQTTCSKTFLKVLRLSELHQESYIYLTFLRFSFPHAISSGEMAFLSMFSRLFERFSKFDSNYNSKRRTIEALVFFDEAETTLHPNFQRKLVFNAIWFFETFFPHAKVHLIFASHSPILLSDIPKDNCEFLVRRTEDGQKPVETSELKRIQNTFGANIFDLYRIPFFMNNGTMGVFAEKKINRIIDLLNQAFPSAQTDQEGNQTQLSQKELREIRELKPLIGDGFLLRYIESTLHFIAPYEDYETWQSE